MAKPTTLIEPLNGVQDIWADGIARVEHVGDIARFVFFRWSFADGVWHRETLDFAMCLPLAAGLFAAGKIPTVRINEDEVTAQHH